jgi:hypothetical protein
MAENVKWRGFVSLWIWDVAAQDGHVDMRKNIMSMFLFPMLIACNSCAVTHKIVENNIDNSVITLNGIEYITLSNGTLVEARICEDVVDMIFKRIKAIEDGDLAAFRSTLGEIQDGVDYYYQLGLIFDFFGDFFDIDPDTFYDAVATGSEDLPKIADTLFNSEHPLKSRNTGLSIKRLEIISGSGLNVILINNKNEKIIYNFLYY